MIWTVCVRTEEAAAFLSEHLIIFRLAILPAVFEFITQRKIKPKVQV